MNQNPNNPEYNPYTPSPSAPNYPPVPDSRYGGPPAQNPGSGPVSGPGYDSYANPSMPITGTGASNPYNPYAPPPPPTGGNATQYGSYGNDPTYITAPPPPGTDYSAPPPPVYQQSYMPPVQPTPRNKGRGSVVLILVIVLVLVVGASIFGVFAHNNQVASQNRDATATAQSGATAQVQAQATGTAQSYATATTVASTYPFFSHLVFNDPLTDNSNKQIGWQTSADCVFSGNSYQATDSTKNTYAGCVGLLTNFSNFTFQVDGTLKQGDSQSGLGLYFRADDAKSRGYLFYVDQDGSYSFFISTDGTGGNSRDLKDGQVTASQYTTGLSQKNTFSVVARDSQISIYINQQLILSTQDSTYSSGQIGVLVTDGTTKAVASFNNAKLWTA